MKPFELCLLNENRVIAKLDPPGVEGYVLGRSDNQSSVMPDVDLGKYNARERGVSRRHAAIVRYQDATHIVDLGSVNGTFVNNRRLPADYPYRLKHNDRITLGDMEMEVTFE